MNTALKTDHQKLASKFKFSDPTEYQTNNGRNPMFIKHINARDNVQNKAIDLRK